MGNCAHQNCAPLWQEISNGGRRLIRIRDISRGEEAKGKENGNKEIERSQPFDWTPD
jgi:hypothetical protein